MKIEAPYKGREDAPQGQAPEPASDKPDSEVEANVTTSIEADKANAPAEEPEVEEETGEIEEPAEEEESPEVPDVDLIRMRSDYSKKTAEVARQREAITRREAELAERYGVYEQVDALIAQNPALAKTHTVEQLVALIQSGTAPVGTSSLPPEARREIESMRREVAETRRESQETKESLFADRVESSVKRVAKQYGLKRPQVEQLVKFAVEDEQIVPGMDVERINRRLVLIARGMTYKGAEAKGQTKLVKQLAEKGRAASGGTATQATTADASAPRVKGWDNLVKQFTAKAKSG